MKIVILGEVAAYVLFSNANLFQIYAYVNQSITLLINKQMQKKL